MKIHVINLVRSADRRAYIAEQLDPLALSYTFFEAIDASKGELSGISRYDEKAALWKLGHPLVPAEVGCFASHYQLWKHCVALGQPIVIMEDDIKIAPGFMEAFKLCSENIQQYRFLRLSGMMQRKHKVIAQLGSHQLIRYLKGPFGGHCYALTPEAAAAFLAHADKWIDALDKYIDAFWTHGVVSYGIVPYHIDLSTADTPASQIDPTRLLIINRPWHRKLRRRITLLFDRFARVSFNLRQR